MANEIKVLDENALRRTIKSVLYTERLTRNDPPLGKFPLQERFGFKIVRGTAVAAVESGDTTFKIENLVSLIENADTPSDPLTVSNVPALLTLALGDLVYAIFSYNTDTSGTFNISWEAFEISGGGTSELFTVSIIGSIAAGSAAAMVNGTGTVYEIGLSGSTSSIGTQTIWNPYGTEAAGDCTCQKIGDDYTLTGLDIRASLYLFTGAAEKKILWLPEGATSGDDIAWAGEECP